jgi:hypothetical protein
LEGSVHAALPFGDFKATDLLVAETIVDAAA